jgi:outer membrane protein assembly factor BamD (BamD/ComL family)
MAADTLGRERVLLDLARSALASGDTSKALAAAQSHETQFPAGQLVEEREALMVQVLWNGGRRDDAVRRLHAFSAQFPDSPLRSSLDAMMR